MQLNDTRAYLPEHVVGCYATDVTTLHKDGMVLFALDGASTTGVTCPAYSNLPHGLRFKIDNSHGSGAFTLTPASGTATVVAAGKVYDYYVAADGTLLATELAAAPT